jgi:hypothetical protein
MWEFDPIMETNLVDIGQQVHQLRNNVVAQNSMTIYRNSFTKFILWCLRFKQNVIPDRFMQMIDTTANDKYIIGQLKLLIDGNLENPPLLFTELSASLASDIEKEKRFECRIFNTQFSSSRII